MNSALKHRGPNDQGLWIEPDVGLGFGHRRLSVIDLSAAGHEPMHSASGRFIITFNGEIYNHQDLRSQLEQEEATPRNGWRGHSDVEVLLECIDHWGLEITLQRSVGMFAFALWDRTNRHLRLVRDRFGEKPLYYGWSGDDFVFASELKAIRALPGFNNSICRSALALFVARTYIPAPLSIYSRLYKLEPGCILTVENSALTSPRDDAPTEGSSENGLTLARYWDYRDVIRSGAADPISEEHEALERLEFALNQSIRGQAMADVPIGAFLSGGIDSSTIVALYQNQSSIPIRTFSIGFEEEGFDEAKYAAEIARHFGTVHNELYVTSNEARDVIPLLPEMFDEPFADSSQIPTYLVSKFAHQQVTVALSGDGGDELFAGYNRHFAAPSLWRRLQRVPMPVRALAGPMLSEVPAAVWDAAPGRRAPNFGSKIQKAFRVSASARSFDDVCSSFFDEWAFDESPLREKPAGGVAFDLDLDVGMGVPDAVRMMYCDAVNYLPDDILCKVDRASMAVSLETRVPFLDHRVAEVAAMIPLSMKVRQGRGKYILRTLLSRYAPESLFARPKAGFAMPVGQWLKGPLRAWAEDLLEPKRMAQEGFFNPAVVLRRWNMHLSGRRDSTAAIWAILMFQSWLRQQTEAQRKAA